MDKLPKGWEIVQWSDVATKIGDVDHKMPKETKEGYPYISPRDFLPNNEIDFINAKKISKNDYTELSRKIKPEIGDIIFARYGTIGENRFVKLNVDFLASYSCAVIKHDLKKVLPQFSYYYSLSPQVKIEIEKYINRATQPNIGIQSISKFSFPLPPLPEQARIVNKLDRLFERIDKSIALLEENIKHTEALMASVLDEIFSKINAERFQVKDLSKNIQYGYTGKALDKGEYYYLRITDIQNGKVNFSNTPYSDIPVSQIDKYLLKHGDILFARTGATAGKSYLYNDNEKSVFASYLIRVVCNEEVLIPNYLYCFFQSKGYWNQIFGNIVGAAQPNFNGKKLGEIVVPLPDINTQQKIIEKFESLNKYFEQITFQQQSKLSYLKALKASLLDKAFKGEL